MKRFFSWNTSTIPRGVRTITIATAIRWFGWGFAEALIPILIYSFSSSFAHAGLLRSTLDIAMILAFPIAGIFADRIRSSTLIKTGLYMYLLIGISYFLSGLTGLVVFLIAARVLNGISYALDMTARETYFRRHTPREKVATVFGYFDTVANFWWITAAAIGIFLIPYFQVWQLLLLITPATFVALLVITRFEKTEEEVHPKEKEGGARALVREWTKFSPQLKTLLVINFFFAAASGVITFFIPIEAYTEGANLALVVVFGIVTTIPTLFGFSLGSLFDRKGLSVYLTGLGVFTVLLFSMALWPSYFWKLIAAFLCSVVLELLSVGNNELVTIHTNPEHFGRMAGILRSIADLGNMMGPLALGIVIDSYGINNSFVTLGVIMTLVTFVFYLCKRTGFFMVKAEAVARV